MKPLRAAINEYEDEPKLARSDFEKLFLDFCGWARLPKPDVNAWVEGYEVDMLWRRAKVIVELDSWTFHRTRSAFERDRERAG